jgi:hypothetical protein
MSPVSLDCECFIALAVLSDVDLVLMLPKTSNYLAFQSFDFERT